MRTARSLIAIAALALGCQAVPPREAPEPPARDRVAPAGECAGAPPPTPPDTPAPPARSAELVLTATAYDSPQGFGWGRS